MHLGAGIRSDGPSTAVLPEPLTALRGSILDPKGLCGDFRREEDHLTISDLAATHLSPTYFAELFRAETGPTPGQYRTRLRIERARLLLAETDMPTTMIATDLGYSSSQHFARALIRVWRAGCGCG